MKPLLSIQRSMIWACFCRENENEDKWRKRAYILFSCTSIVFSAFAFGVSVAFLVKYLSIDLEESLYAVFQIFAAILMIYTFIVGFFSKNQINVIFKSLAELHSECKFLILL